MLYAHQRLGNSKRGMNLPWQIQFNNEFLPSRINPFEWSKYFPLKGQIEFTANGNKLLRQANLYDLHKKALNRELTQERLLWQRLVQMTQHHQQHSLQSQGSLLRAVSCQLHMQTDVISCKYWISSSPPGENPPGKDGPSWLVSRIAVLGVITGAG